MVLMNQLAWLSASAFCHYGGKRADGTKGFSQSLFMVCFSPRFVHFYLSPYASGMETRGRKEVTIVLRST